MSDPMTEGAKTGTLFTKSSLIRAYTSGYSAGHNDTVEYTYTDVHFSDRDTYFEEVVDEMIQQGDVSPLGSLGSVESELIQITDEWIDDGNYCAQTVIDLRDTLKAAIADKSEALKVAGEAETAFKALLEDMGQRARDLADYNDKPVELPAGNGVLFEARKSLAALERKKQGMSMDKDKQRIAFAQLMGFKWQVCPVTGRYWLIPPKYQDHMKPETLLDSIPDLSLWEVGKVEGGMSELPDFLNDLNACHEMEKVLTEEQVDEYQDALDRTFKQEDADAYPAACYWFHSTASQRAEAFLRTLNLWTPTGEENE